MIQSRSSLGNTVFGLGRVGFENVNNARGQNGRESLQGAEVNGRNGQDVFRIHPI
jgi:hypothetical protein